MWGMGLIPSDIPTMGGSPCPVVRCADVDQLRWCHGAVIWMTPVAMARQAGPRSGDLLWGRET
jgi:hypothetical protein